MSRIVSGSCASSALAEVSAKDRSFTYVSPQEFIESIQAKKWANSTQLIWVFCGPWNREDDCLSNTADISTWIATNSKVISLERDSKYELRFVNAARGQVNVNVLDTPLTDDVPKVRPDRDSEIIGRLFARLLPEAWDVYERLDRLSCGDSSKVHTRFDDRVKDVDVISLVIQRLPTSHGAEQTHSVDSTSSLIAAGSKASDSSLDSDRVAHTQNATDLLEELHLAQDEILAMQRNLVVKTQSTHLDLTSGESGGVMLPLEELHALQEALEQSLTREKNLSDLCDKASGALKLASVSIARLL